MTVEIKKLTNHEIAPFIELLRVFEDAFEMENFVIPDQNHLQQVLNKDNFMVFVALLNDKVVGGLTAYILEQYYTTLPQVYIYDVAVSPHLQRQGIGKKLIAGINQYCKQTGVEEVFVQADAVDDYALDFYRTTGGRAEEVVHFTYPLNESLL